MQVAPKTRAPRALQLPRRARPCPGPAADAHARGAARCARAPEPAPARVTAPTPRPRPRRCLEAEQPRSPHLIEVIAAVTTVSSSSPPIPPPLVVFTSPVRVMQKRFIKWPSRGFKQDLNSLFRQPIKLEMSRFLPPRIARLCTLSRSIVHRP
jgi:hypothetical protein